MTHSTVRIVRMRMFNFDDDDFYDDETNSSWTQFWSREFDGEPIWYLAAMAAIQL